MAKRSQVANLPKHVRDWLDKALVEGNFSGYQLLEEALREKGFVISKSAIHRYGQKIERRLAAIKASTEAARLLTESAPDERDSRSEAVIAMIQTDLFNSIVSLQDATEADPKDRVKLLTAAAKNVAMLTKASVSLKQFQQQVKERVEAAADMASKIAKKGGLSADAVAQIKREILGISE